MDGVKSDLVFRPLPFQGLSRDLDHKRTGLKVYISGWEPSWAKDSVSSLARKWGLIMLSSVRLECLSHNIKSFNLSKQPWDRLAWSQMWLCSEWCRAYPGRVSTGTTSGPSAPRPPAWCCSDLHRPPSTQVQRSDVGHVHLPQLLDRGKVIVPQVQ